MLSYLELAFAWLLFMSMPILAAGMFYRARKHYSMRENMLSASAHEKISNEEIHFQRYSIIANIAGGVALCTIMAVILLYGLAFAVWSGLAALVIWSYCVAIIILERRRTTLSLP